MKLEYCDRPSVLRFWRTLGVRFACEGRRGKGASGQAAALHWSGLRCAPTALRCSVSWPRRSTHVARCARCVQTAATSQRTTRAAREATSPALLGAPEARPVLPGRAFAGAVLVFASNTQAAASRQAVPGGGDFCGDEKRRPGVGARSALRGLTRRGCLNAANAVSEVSSAARPQGEHRSGVGAKRRPPQHEPPAGTACRDALRPRQSERPPTVALARRQMDSRSVRVSSDGLQSSQQFLTARF